MSSKRRSSRLHHADLTLRWAWGTATGVTFWPQTGNRVHNASCSSGNKAYREASPENKATCFLVGRGEAATQYLLETLELKERYFILGNMNYPVVCNQMLPLLSPPVWDSKVQLHFSYLLFKTPIIFHSAVQKTKQWSHSTQSFTCLGRGDNFFHDSTQNGHSPWGQRHTGFSDSQKPQEGHNEEGRDKGEMEQPLFFPTPRIIQACK